MASVSTSGATATDTKVNGSFASDTAMDAIYSTLATPTWVSMPTVKLKDTANIDG